MWYTYVLYSASHDKFYIGSTGDLRQRIADHKAGHTKTTAALKAFELVYYEACLSKTDALKREKQLKTGFGRGYINKRLENYFTGP